MKSIQKKLKEAILERDRAKVIYDAHKVILDGQKKMLEEMEERQHNFTLDLIKANTIVSEIKNTVKNILNHE